MFLRMSLLLNLFDLSNKFNKRDILIKKNTLIILRYPYNIKKAKVRGTKP